MYCEHKDIEIKEIKNEYLGEYFTYNQAQVCSDCKSFLRDQDFDEALSHWLKDLYQTKRNKFQIQCHISEHMRDCSKQFLEKYPSVDMSTLFRVFVIVYLEHIESNNTLYKRFVSLLDKDVRESFDYQRQDKIKLNIQFKPAMRIEIDSLAQAVGVPSSKIVENSISKMLSAVFSCNKELKEFCKKNINEYIDLMLKSA